MALVIKQSIVAGELRVGDRVVLDGEVVSARDSAGPDRLEIVLGPIHATAQDGEVIVVVPGSWRVALLGEPPAGRPEPVGVAPTPRSE
jgi:hypothetical protein